jgi:hypothetical protein
MIPNYLGSIIMHILLINANPVVSRLLILCTREDAFLLDEVKDVEEVQRDEYDIVFVDEGSYGRDVATFLAKLKDSKKVFISYRSDAMRGFDVVIKKPFLPSQITDILVDLSNKTEKNQELSLDSSLDAEMEGDLEAMVEKEEDSPVVLDIDEIEKIKTLLDMDEDLELPDIELSDEERETRKIELIKEQLIADGLEIIDEDEIIEELSIGLDGTLGSVEKAQKKKSKSKKSKKKNKAKKLKFTDEMLKTIEDAVKMVMASMTKKQMKKLLKGKEIEVKIKLEDTH